MTKQKGPTIPDLQKAIRQSFRQWRKLKNGGGTDPFWADGANMNLTVAHIHNDQRRLKALCKEQKVRPCPIESKMKAPKGVSSDYCAPRSKAGPCKERRAAARKKKK